MAQRCLELLNLSDSEPRLLLDIGCGSGLSGGEQRCAACILVRSCAASARHRSAVAGVPLVAEVLAEAGHAWVGVDISPSMLSVALERGVSEGGDMLLGDMGQGMGFRAGCFDGAIR